MPGCKASVRRSNSARVTTVLQALSGSAQNPLSVITASPGPTFDADACCELGAEGDDRSAWPLARLTSRRQAKPRRLMTKYRGRYSPGNQAGTPEYACPLLCSLSSLTVRTLPC